MKKINVAELLKDCPKGMELDCTMIDNVVFEKLDFISSHHPIIIRRTDSNKTIHLTKYGQYSDEEDYKCVIFPKGKTTWEGFVPPCKFKDGDIVFSGVNLISIFKCIKEEYSGSLHSYVSVAGDAFEIDKDCWTLENIRFATEKEKEKLFKVIKDNGYKWNSETKTLEKLITPKFHLGQWITDGYLGGQITSIEDNYSCYKIAGFIGGISISIPFILQDNYHLWTIQDAKDGDVLFHSDSASNGVFIFKEILQHGTIQKVACYCDYDSEDGLCLGENHTCCWTDSKTLHPATKEQSDLLFQKIKEAGYKWNPNTETLEKLIEPKFKVGDRIRLKNGGSIIEVTSINNDSSICVNGMSWTIKIEQQDNYELVPNKFDITTLIPFESRVLVRATDNQFWRPAIWGVKHCDWDYSCVLGGDMWEQCIPYECNGHLLGKTDDCADFYKFWE